MNKNELINYVPDDEYKVEKATKNADPETISDPIRSNRIPIQRFAKSQFDLARTLSSSNS